MSDRRALINQANSLRSTGPRSEVGKQVVSQNAITHGLFASRLFLPGEDPQEYEALHGGLCRALRPVGALEDILVDRLAVTLWRQLRLVRWEQTREGAYGEGFGALDFAGQVLQHYAMFDAQVERQLRAFHAAQEKRLQTFDGELAP